jgi:phage tail sheath gpL-like
MNGLMQDIGRPLHRIRLRGITAINRNDRWTLSERNQVAVSGISTLTFENGSATENVVSMYLRNSAGALDPAWRRIGTGYKLAYARYAFVNRINSKYPQARLAASSEKMKDGLQVMTPKIGRDEALAWFRDMEQEGIFQNYELFKESLRVTPDNSNPERLNWLLPPNLVTDFVVGSGDILFALGAGV